MSIISSIKKRANRKLFNQVMADLAETERTKGVTGLYACSLDLRREMGVLANERSCWFCDESTTIKRALLTYAEGLSLNLVDIHKQLEASFPSPDFRVEVSVLRDSQNRRCLRIYLYARTQEREYGIAILLSDQYNKYQHCAEVDSDIVHHINEALHRYELTGWNPDSEIPQ